MPFKPVVLWTDALVYLLVAVVLMFVWHVRRNEYLLVPWRRVGHSASGMAALTVLMFFIAVGLLDTVHLRPTVENANGGAGETAYSVEVLSLLDIIATPLRTRVEKTYSAPFAAHLYARETVELPDGGQTREFPRLEIRRGASAGSGSAADARRCLESAAAGEVWECWSGALLSPYWLLGWRAQRNETFISALSAIWRRSDSAIPWNAVCYHSCVDTITMRCGTGIMRQLPYLRYRQGGAGRFLPVAEKHSHRARDRNAYHADDAAFCAASGHHGGIFPWLGG